MLTHSGQHLIKSRKWADGKQPLDTVQNEKNANSHKLLKRTILSWKLVAISCCRWVNRQRRHVVVMVVSQSYYGF